MVGHHDPRITANNAYNNVSLFDQGYNKGYTIGYKTGVIDGKIISNTNNGWRDVKTEPLPFILNEELLVAYLDEEGNECYEVAICYEVALKEDDESKLHYLCDTGIVTSNIIAWKKIEKFINE